MANILSKASHTSVTDSPGAVGWRATAIRKPTVAARGITRPATEPNHVNVHTVRSPGHSHESNRRDRIRYLCEGRLRTKP
jgi:hypothetical protein